MKPTIKTMLTLVAIATTGAASLTMLPQTQHTQRHEPTDNEAQAVQKMTQYQALATITLQQALATAEAAQGTPAAEIELSEEGGSLIYEVEFANGTEIIVDAGNNTILKTERPNEATAASSRQGSIQLPEDISAELDDD